MRAALGICVLLLFAAATPARGQVLVANDDEFGILFGEPLLIEAFGVLENDTLDGEPAGELGASAELVTDVSFGTLLLQSDGSFSYSPGVDFDGLDQFVYLARSDTITAEATVILTACSGGPELFTCWSEAAFLAKVTAFGYSTFQEGFENDAVWGVARTPSALPWVVSQGIRWTSNHPDPPASNPISTTSGPPHTGQWAIYDPEHGYATGTPTVCDVDQPPDSCLYYDGFSGTREAGYAPLNGVGGYTSGIYGINVGIALDGALPIGGGKTGGGHQFFGVVDARPAGFTHFEFRELDGKVGQALYVFGDDFTLVGVQPTPAPVAVASRLSFRGAYPNPCVATTTLHFSLPEAARVRLAIYNQRGRLVRTLFEGTRGPGPHAVAWDARDQNGNRVSAGIFLGRLEVRGDGASESLSQKIVVLR